MKIVPIIAIGATVGLLTGSSLAYASNTAQFNPEIVELTQACAPSHGWQEFEFSLATFDGMNQKSLMDDGKTTLEIHAINGRFGFSGQWITVDKKFLSSGGENHLRFSVDSETSQGVLWDHIRIRHNGWGSNVFPSGQVNC